MYWRLQAITTRTRLRIVIAALSLNQPPAKHERMTPGRARVTVIQPSRRGIGGGAAAEQASVPGALMATLLWLFDPKRQLQNKRRNLASCHTNLNHDLFYICGKQY